MTFVLREGRHGTYRRVGDDLHAEVVVSPRQLREGWTLSVPPLRGGPIRLRLGPNEVGDGGTVTVKSRGWPLPGGRDGGGGGGGLRGPAREGPVPCVRVRDGTFSPSSTTFRYRAMCANDKGMMRGEATTHPGWDAWVKITLDGRDNDEQGNREES